VCPKSPRRLIFRPPAGELNPLLGKVITREGGSNPTRFCLNLSAKIYRQAASDPPSNCARIYLHVLPERPQAAVSTLPPLPNRLPWLAKWLGR